MKLSVSATCLSQEAFEDDVLSLLELPVADLHCDYFPEIDTAPSLSLDQIDWCVKHWPRSLSFHLWGEAGLSRLPASARLGQLLIQLHDASDEQIEIAHGAAQRGWQTGISLLPHLVPEVMDRVAFPLSAVQVLSTTTPGFPGGSYDHATWKALSDLQDRRTNCNGEWMIVVDGGLTPEIIAELANECDLGVVGTNYLSRHPIADQLVPKMFGEPACQKIFSA